MNNKYRLQFSIGPVQSFVAQSRRTRDLWSSSFLLSHLAATAIDVVKGAGGQLVLPHHDSASGQSGHSFGTIPNRFISDFDGATVDEAMERAKAAACEAKTALLDEWRKIADAVWDAFVSDVASQPTISDGTRTIWERQIESFWEISWVVGSVDEAGTLLAARKNWRTTPATVEPGDHCTMMSDRQELSGWIRSMEIERKRRGDENRQDEFWKRLRIRLGMLDLDEDERLCAISLIKRLFPKVSKATIGRDLNQTNWPSTAYIAAIPWLVRVAEAPATRSDASTYGDRVLQLAKNSLGERFSTIPKLNDLKNQGQTGKFLNLDGNFFQRAAMANEKVTPFEKLPEGIDDAPARRALQKQFGELCEAVNEKPSAFYALLLMDGDSMGALLGEARKSESDAEAKASKALSNFSRGVPDIVGKHLGVTIYAGGDDVLAMLPVEGTLNCAMELAEIYRTAFKDTLNESISNLATLSGAIVYAHYHTPLRDVLRTAHHLLDEVAKDATGRDSLAVAVYKSSGITAQWSAPWDHIREVGENAKAENIIDALIADLSGDSDSRGSLREPMLDRGAIHDHAAGSHSAEFSSGFLYNVRERFAALTDRALTKPGEFGRLSPELTGQSADAGSDLAKTDGLLKSVLVADLMRGKQHQMDGPDQRDLPESARHEAKRKRSEEAVNRLLKLSQRVTRHRVDGSAPPTFESIPEPDTLGIDGALLVRFLAVDGKEDSE